MSGTTHGPWGEDGIGLFDTHSPHACPYCESPPCSGGSSGGRRGFLCGTIALVNWPLMHAAMEARSEDPEDAGDQRSEMCFWLADLRAESADWKQQAEGVNKDLLDTLAKAKHMRTVVDAAIRRRDAWIVGDDDAENIAADLAEDAAVDAYGSSSSEPEANDA